ncbi:hypothetical protein LQZ18_07085 [Lachnospiraceae bacterium ZAX-1]
MATADSNTDIRNEIVEYAIGLWCENGNEKTFQIFIEKMVDKDLCKKMGTSARNLLLSHLTVEQQYKTMDDSLRNRKKQKNEGGNNVVIRGILFLWKKVS